MLHVAEYLTIIAVLFVATMFGLWLLIGPGILQAFKRQQQAWKRKLQAQDLVVAARGRPQIFIRSASTHRIWCVCIFAFLLYALVFQ